MGLCSGAWIYARGFVKYLHGSLWLLNALPYFKPIAASPAASSWEVRPCSDSNAFICGKLEKRFKTEEEDVPKLKTLECPPNFMLLHRRCYLVSYCLASFKIMLTVAHQVSSAYVKTLSFTVYNQIVWIQTVSRCPSFTERLWALKCDLTVFNLSVINQSYSNRSVCPINNMAQSLILTGTDNLMGKIVEVVV